MATAPPPAGASPAATGGGAAAAAAAAPARRDLLSLYDLVFDDAAGVAGGAAPSPYFRRLAAYPAGAAWLARSRATGGLFVVERMWADFARRRSLKLPNKNRLFASEYQRLRRGRDIAPLPLVESFVEPVAAAGGIVICLVMELPPDAEVAASERVDSGGLAVPEMPAAAAPALAAAAPGAAPAAEPAPIVVGAAAAEPAPAAGGGDVVAAEAAPAAGVAGGAGAAPAAVAPPPACPVLGGPTLLGAFAFDVVDGFALGPDDIPSLAKSPCFLCLERGSFGATWIARSRADDERLAVKRIHESEAAALGERYVWDATRIWGREMEHLATRGPAAAFVAGFLERDAERGGLILSIVTRQPLPPNTALYPRCIATSGRSAPSPSDGGVALPEGGRALGDFFEFERVQGFELGERGVLSCTPTPLQFQCLGAGAFGSVWVVRSKETGDRLAVKRIAPKDAKDAQSVYAREVVLQRDLAPDIADKPDAAASIIRFVDGFMTNNPLTPRVVSIVMELSPVARPECTVVAPGAAPLRLGGSGCDLCDHPQFKPPMRLACAREVLRQILKALEYWHSKGMVHRDIKPDNTLVFDTSVTAEGVPFPRVKVSDFGMARFFDPAFMTFGEGTPSYNSPERRRDYYTTATDIFAAGCSLVALISASEVSTNTALSYPERFADFVKANSNCEYYEGQNRATWSPDKIRAVDLCSQLVGHQNDDWAALVGQLRAHPFGGIPADEVAVPLLSTLRRLKLTDPYWTSVFFEYAGFPAAVHATAVQKLSRVIPAHLDLLRQMDDMRCAGEPHLSTRCSQSPLHAGWRRDDSAPPVGPSALRPSPAQFLIANPNNERINEPHVNQRVATTTTP